MPPEAMRVPKMAHDSRLLIVDDEAPVRRVLRRWLEADGYSCQAAASATDAWKLLQESAFNLVISDVRMPGESGIELLAKVRGHFGPELAMMLATADVDPETAYRALELGASQYLMKPFGRNDVVIAVAAALDQQRRDLQSQRRQNRLTDLVRRRDEEMALRLVWAAECRDTDTGSHIRRIGLYSRELAKNLGWSPADAEQLRLAAAMHDIGKIGIPDEILLKPGALDAKEIVVMRTHTEQGARMLRGSTSTLLQLAEEIALHHHERWDGAGYPEGLSGEKIPEAARIVAVVDVYDALTHDRPYRPAHSEERALEIMMRGRGKVFDPRILDLFMKILPRIRSIRTPRADEDPAEGSRCA